MDEDLTWRPFRTADLPAVAELAAAAETVDDEGEWWSAQDIADELASPSIDPERGAFAAFTRDGQAVAVTLLFARTAANPVHEMFAWSAVHPRWRGRGIGTELTERSVAAAREISELRFPGAPAILQRNSYDQVADRLEHLERHGFARRHYEVTMERPIKPEEAAVAPVPPEGYTLVAYAADLADEFRAMHNAVFVADHPGSTPQTPASWAAMAGSDAFRPDLSFGLRDQVSGELAGYVLTRYYEADTVATGRRDAYLNYIGTRREHRGRGVASAVIAAVIHAGARRGFDHASLSVRVDNPSGALGVYQRAGFASRRTFVNQARELN